MVKVIAYTLCLVGLIGCANQNAVDIENQKQNNLKGIIYDTKNGHVTDVYDSTPPVILNDSVYHKYICEKVNIYAGAASRNEYITYKKTFVGYNMTKFEVVGKHCKIIN